MKHGATGRAILQYDVLRWMVMAGVLVCGLLLLTLPARASGAQVPWECSNYGEEAQARCMNAFIEQQREQIVKLEGQLQEQRETVGRLKSQLDQQSATTSNLQQQLSQRQAPVVAPAPYLYSYTYPPVGLGLYLGRPRVYGPPYFYHPYWGPRFYGRWGRRW